MRVINKKIEHNFSLQDPHDGLIWSSLWLMIVSLKAMSYLMPKIVNGGVFSCDN